MNIVGRIQFPTTIDIYSLYMKCDEGASITYSEGSRKIDLTKGSIVSFNTYFNSFYESFYVKYTELCYLYYLLKLEGEFQVSIYREFYGREDRELIYIENFEKCQLLDYVKIVLPNISKTEDPGRLYLEIICLSECGVFTEGLIVTEQDRLREVSLGIITCTFKKEAYVKNTVSKILQDGFLKNKDFKIFVVDNGRTLNEDDFKDRRVQLISNRKNVGGSGGFTRGLLEALREEIYTHFLFMDDDIELDSESIYRLVSLYEYAKRDFTVAGSMLDLRKKYVLYEAGALYSQQNDSSGSYTYSPFSVSPLKHNLDLQDNTSLNILLLEENIDFGGFWFFSFSKEVIDKIGLPMPFFIKIDDMEFCLRIKESLGYEIVAFPSIAVWHDPFYAKFSVWSNYYAVRNFLITHSLRSSLGYINAVKHLTKRIVSLLLFFDYNSAEMLIKAFEDYMKGSVFIQSSEPELLHYNVLELSKHYKSPTLAGNYYSHSQFYKKSMLVRLKKVISMLTLNGHLLPSFLMSNDEAFVLFGPGHYHEWYKAFAKKKAIIFREENDCFSEHEFNQLAGIIILTRWFKVAIKSSITWSVVSAEWKIDSKKMASTEFWQKYLDL